jgi:hypothetical protein
MPHPKGGYKLNGKSLPGTTTIISRFKDSGALLFWAFEQGKAAERGEIQKLYDKRDDAADAGTLCHLLVEKHINGEKFTIEWLLEQAKQNQSIADQAAKGFSNYLQWETNSQIKIIAQEMELISEKYEFGGCPDAIGQDGQGRICLVDWKTSNGVYPDYLIQLAAYKQLWEENQPDRPITGGFHLCRFSKENADFAHHYWSELDDAWEQFRLLRQAYDIDKKLKKRV